MKETCISFPSSPSYSTETMRSLHLDSAGVWYKREQHAIVAASPPTEDAVIATEPLTKEDLVKAVIEEMGIGFLGIGFQPKWGLKDVPIMPKGRYEIMRNYMPKVGFLGLDMMFRTCTVQVNLVFSSEADMIRKFRASLALQPIATSLFANSPFTEGKLNGYLSKRRFEQYVDYALDVPMYFVYRKNKCIDCIGMSFQDFMSGKLVSIPGELPTLNDWENHLTTIFPEVRLKRCLEMRGADGGPWRRLCALPAFWVGLLYDEVSLQNVLDMIADWTPQERQMLRNKVPTSGLKTPFRDGGMMAWKGEASRKQGVTPAEKLLEM
ncbi:hypothetical protein ACSBR1_038713 [Camellia fascicularis]